ncbi:MAG: rod shape-determining protein [Chitinophagales bacterium]|nr:rod shape-determining protein [Chitinophagales bacterium]
MGLLSFLNKEIAIDLGTANTLIIYKDQVVVDEPSIVAIDKKTENVIAVGKRAMLMHEKTHANIETIRPLKDGVIADFKAAEAMIRGFIAMINERSHWFKPSLTLVVCVPSGCTQVEMRAVIESAERANARERYLIQEPMAAALGIGLDVEQPEGHMIIDIGGGTSEIAVIALSGIVLDRSIRVGGDEFTLDIIEHVRKQHNMLIGERTAEQIKIHVGAAIQDLENPPEDFAVHGRDLLTGIPKQIIVTYTEIAGALDKSIAKIEEGVMKALESTPPELASDIYQKGINLTGGGALLRGLDKRLRAKTKLPVNVADDPLRAVVRGTGLALKNRHRYTFLMS